MQTISRLVAFSAVFVFSAIGSCFAGAGGGCILPPTNVPEPTTLAVLGVGASAVAGYRWWKARK